MWKEKDLYYRSRYNEKTDKDRTFGVEIYIDDFKNIGLGFSISLKSCYLNLLWLNMDIYWGWD